MEKSATFYPTQGLSRHFESRTTFDYQNPWRLPTSFCGQHVQYYGKPTKLVKARLSFGHAGVGPVAIFSFSEPCDLRSFAFP